MLVGSIEIVVHAHDDIQGLLLHGRRDNHLLDAAFEVRGEQRGRAELARGLEHYVYAGPRDFTRGLMLGERNRLAVDENGACGSAHVVLPSPVNGVERQKMCRGLRPTVDLVDVDEFQVGRAPRRAKSEPSHAAEAVDTNASGHAVLLPQPSFWMSEPTRCRIASLISRTRGSGFPFGSSSGQSSCFAPGTTGHASPHPMVIRSAACRAISGVSRRGGAPSSSTPASRITSTISG